MCTFPFLPFSLYSLSNDHRETNVGIIFNDLKRKIRWSCYTSGKQRTATTIRHIEITELFRVRRDTVEITWQLACKGLTVNTILSVSTCDVWYFTRWIIVYVSLRTVNKTRALFTTPAKTLASDQDTTSAEALSLSPYISNFSHEKESRRIKGW